jgi:hypothetical protein
LMILQLKLREVSCLKCPAKKWERIPFHYPKPPLCSFGSDYCIPFCVSALLSTNLILRQTSCWLFCFSQTSGFSDVITASCYYNRKATSLQLLCDLSPLGLGFSICKRGITRYHLPCCLMYSTSV